MKKLLLVYYLISTSLFAQENSEIKTVLIGNWEGAFIKNNSYQKFEFEIYKRNDNLYSLQIMNEWHPTFGEFEVPITITDTNQIQLGTGYGVALLNLDIKNLELVGQLKGFNPSIYIHLKKIAKKPKPNFTVKEFTVNSKTNKVFGHIHTPLENKLNTAIIFVGGRGCGVEQTKYNLYAKFLRKYGFTVVAYHKQGTGKSTGDCSKATITSLAYDVISIKNYLTNQPNNYQKVGVLGVSAGGWTMTKAAEKTDFDFMISIVGPSTSVKEQQIQSAKYGAKFYDLNRSSSNNLMAYLDLMYKAKANEKNFEKFQDLLVTAKKEKWNQLLEDTDIPKNAVDINNLWVRRHDYNPKKVLNNYNKPFLAIYGDRDWIVPYKENVSALNTYFSNNKDNLKTVVAYNAEHGMEMEAKTIDLGNNQSYWHFYRISPEVRIEIVNFLEKHGFLEQ